MLLFAPQRRRSRSGRSRWDWLDFWEKEFTTLESWWDFGLAACRFCRGQPFGRSLTTSAVVSLQLMHPVLESLRNTDKQWLIDTLYAFNGGNVEKFQGFKSAWGQQVIDNVCVPVQYEILKAV